VSARARTAAYLAAPLVAVFTLTGCEPDGSMPLWVNGYSIRAAIAILLIPIVLYCIYKGYYDDRPGGWGGGDGWG